jgi:transcriptional regulator with XRE-family HTH domain
MPYSTECHPDYAARIKGIRESRGLSFDEVAKNVGLSWNEYFDLELHADEVLMCISLGQLAALGRVLGVAPSVLLTKEETSDHPLARLSRSDLSARIQAFIDGAGISLSEFEEQVGWEIAQALYDSDEILDWNVDCLSDVCSAIGVNWLEALPE